MKFLQRILALTALLLVGQAPVFADDSSFEMQMQKSSALHAQQAKMHSQTLKGIKKLYWGTGNLSENANNQVLEDLKSLEVPKEKLDANSVIGASDAILLVTRTYDAGTYCSMDLNVSQYCNLERGSDLTFTAVTYSDSTYVPKSTMSRGVQEMMQRLILNFERANPSQK